MWTARGPLKQSRGVTLEEARGNSTFQLLSSAGTAAALGWMPSSCLWAGWHGCCCGLAQLVDVLPLAAATHLLKGQAMAVQPGLQL